MSESQLPLTLNGEQSSLTPEQMQAMWRFLRNFGNASLYLVLLPGFIVLITGLLGLITGEWIYWPDLGFRGAAITGVLALVYFLILIVIIWNRTGLKWYLLGENSFAMNLFVFVPVWLLYTGIVPLEVRFSLTGLVALFATALLLTFIHKRLERAWRPHLYQERRRYADYWPELGHLSFADVLFLRIPVIKVK